MSSKLLAALLAAVLPSQALADCTPDWISATIADTYLLDNDAIELALTISNSGTHPIGGAIIRYTVTAPGRPSPLADAPSQMANTLEGGLLPGEATTIRDVISLPDHAANIIAAMDDVSVVEIEARVSGIADGQMRPIGTSRDPFQLWANTPSDLGCDDLD